MNFSFRRTISQRVETGEDGSILLESSMEDRYHRIMVEAVVDPSTLVIRRIGGRFDASPEPACERSLARLSLLEGTVVGKGMARRVSEALGGGEGCGNLKTMLLSLLPLAVNAAAARGGGSEEQMLKRMHEALAGTCAGYPLNGDSPGR